MRRETPPPVVMEKFPWTAKHSYVYIPEKDTNVLSVPQNVCNVNADTLLKMDQARRGE